MSRHRCPACSTPLLPIHYGMGITEKQHQAVMRGEMAVWGCEPPTYRPAGWCPTCGAARGFECPVCGYRRLVEAPWDGPQPSGEPCPCCGTRFGVDTTVPYDEGAHERLRQQWVEGGCRWASTQIKPPRRWTPHRQLERVEGL